MYKKSSLHIVVFVVGLVAIFGGLIYWAGRNNTAPGALDVFASCLRDKGVTMYGAAWCPHCQNEKKAFGTSFRLVPYVECPENPAVCIEKKIESYPTWILSENRRLVGEQGVQRLSDETGCPLPQQ
ncbi:MAG: hypothetical protein AAB495_04150 [Patescibacteria group bacterium]